MIVTNVDGGAFECQGCLTVTSSGSDRPGYLYGTGHTSYNAGATAITPSNAGQLAPEWKWLPPPSPNSPTTSLLASPTVVDGVVYQSVKDGYIFAIRKSDQSVIWSRFLAINTPLPASNPSCGAGDYQGVISTASVKTDPATGKLTVYVYAPDGFVYALDAATGDIVWKGKVYSPSTAVNDYYSWGSPLVANGKVYVGISSDCDNPLVPGGLVSFDQGTGASVAQWASTAPGQVGASVWRSPAALDDGSIVVTTGNAPNSSGQPLYNESIVHLDPATLQLIDYWQVPPHQQAFDSDFGASPTVFSATINGVSAPMVGACNKNGIYYAFRQSSFSAGPVWQTRISVPYPGGAQECDAAATWDGTRLIEAGGAPTTIAGTTYLGSIQSLNPATGIPLWQTGLNGTIVGSPTEDGGGVVAAPTYQTCSSATVPCVAGAGPPGMTGVYLVSAATGAISGFLPTPLSPLFGQPVFVGDELILGAGSHLGLTAYQVSTRGGTPHGHVQDPCPGHFQIGDHHRKRIRGFGVRLGERRRGDRRQGDRSVSDQVDGEAHCPANCQFRRTRYLDQLRRLSCDGGQLQWLPDRNRTADPHVARPESPPHEPRSAELDGDWVQIQIGTENV